MYNNVDVDGTAGVLVSALALFYRKTNILGGISFNSVRSFTYVAWEQCVELDHTIVIGLGDAAQEGFVQVRSVIIVAVALRLDSAVDTGSIRIPDISPNSGQGLASGDVDELQVRGDGDAHLIIDQVGTNVLARNVEWPNLAFRVEDGAGGIGEDILFSMISSQTPR